MFLLFRLYLVCDLIKMCLLVAFQAMEEMSFLCSTVLFGDLFLEKGKKNALT